MAEEYIIWTVTFFIYSFAFVVHGIGLYAIIGCKVELSQSQILFNLSILELVCIIYSQANVVGNILQFERGTFDEASDYYAICKLPKPYEEINWGIYFSLVLQYFFIMLILVLDRLAAVVRPIKYRGRGTAIKKILVFTWLFTFTLGALYICFPVIHYVLLWLFVGIGSLYLKAVIVSYSIIIFKLLKSQRFRTSSVHPSQQHIKFKKRYMIPGLIVISFIVFGLVPYMVSKLFIPTSYMHKSEYILSQCMKSLMGVNFIIDPLIYVFVTKDYRNVISKMRLRCQNVVHVQDVNNDIPLRNNNIVRRSKLFTITLPK